MSADSEPPGVAVLYNVTQRLVKGEPQDLLADRPVVACARAVCNALAAAGHRVALAPITSELEEALAPYPPGEWVVFNLGEGLEGRLFEEARIAWALEALGYRFTGSHGDAIALSVHKARAKAVLQSHGVATPPAWVLRSPDDVDWATVSALPFPLIVKPLAEDASLGIGPEAVVASPQALRDRVAYVVERYRQAALAEAFIAGRELNVALWGDPPQALPLAEIDFSACTDPLARIVSFADKWDQGSSECRRLPVLCPAPLGPELAADVTVTACRAWTALGCRNYARVDMRVSPEGVPYVLEVNCNPDLSPDAGFARSARAASYTFGDMVGHILELALRQPGIYDRESTAYRWPVYSKTNGRHQHLQPHGVELRRRALERLSGQRRGGQRI